MNFILGPHIPSCLRDNVFRIVAVQDFYHGPQWVWEVGEYDKEAILTGVRDGTVIAVQRALTPGKWPGAYQLEVKLANPKMSFGRHG